MKAIFANAKVGDQVWSDNMGNGLISEIKYRDLYPIRCSFTTVDGETVRRSYTTEGIYMTIESYPTLHPGIRPKQTTDCNKTHQEIFKCFYDNYINTQDQIDKLQGISTAFYTTCNLVMMETLDKICDQLRDNTKNMRDNFTKIRKDF